MDADRRLLEDCLAGKPGAWEAFVARFSPYLAEACRRTLARCGRPAGPQEVQDVLQDVLLACLGDDFRVLRAYREPARVATYLAAVVVHRALKDLRLPLSVPFRDRPSPLPGPEEQAQARELQERLRLEKDRLPLKSRLALAMKADGASLREIGHALRLSEAAAGQRVSRATAELRLAFRPSP